MAVPAHRPGLGPGTQAISQILLVIHLGLGYGSIHCYRAPEAGPLWKASPWSPPQTSVEPELDLYFNRDWIKMSQRNTPSIRGGVVKSAN